MRILLIAYEFAPSPSPQSLRWTYLCRELARRGHELHVLTIDLGGNTPGLPELDDSIHIHRTFAGPFRGVFALRRNLTASRVPPDPTPNHKTSRGGWKHRVSEAVQAALSHLVFPDARGEWRPWAKVRLRHLLHSLKPDLVISSHEPATTLELGLLAHEKGFVWIADLGDPVLAGYTPAHWRKRAYALEAKVCGSAAALLVTSEAARELLHSRHVVRGRVAVVTQGFDLEPAPATQPSVEFDRGRVELLYTGSFYSFRRIDQLLAALEWMPDVRLNVASIAIPAQVQEWATRFPDRIRLLGFLPHRSALQCQRQASVLVNIGNADPVQVPGKLYEYLGAGRPILHIGDEDESVAQLLATTGCGRVCRNSAEAISAALAEIRPLLDNQSELASAHVNAQRTLPYSWQALASEVETIAAMAVGMQGK